MCTVVNGFYCIEYEVINGRKCKPGDVKDVALSFINHTGSLKYIIDVSCQTRDTFITLSYNATTQAKVLSTRILLPPAYRKSGSILFQHSQRMVAFNALISPLANNIFKTIIECTAVVHARANRNDLDALKVISSHPKIYDFYPPLEAV